MIGMKKNNPTGYFEKIFTLPCILQVLIFTNHDLHLFKNANNKFNMEFKKIRQTLKPVSHNSVCLKLYIYNIAQENDLTSCLKLQKE